MGAYTSIHGVFIQTLLLSAAPFPCVRGREKGRGKGNRLSDPLTSNHVRCKMAA